MSRRQWFLVAVALVVILVSGLLFLDLRLARSRTAGDRGIGTYRGGDKLPPKMANAPVVSVAVEGDGAFAEAFRDALRAELWGNNPQIGNVEMVDGAPDAAGDIYMRIEIVREEIVWTPVYARAEVETRMAFSSPCTAARICSWCATCASALRICRGPRARRSRRSANCR